MMKRIVYSILVFAIALSLCMSVAAQNESYVADGAGLLSESERIMLTEELERIHNEYAVDVVVVTVQSLDGQSPQTYADDYYDEHGFGSDGALLLVDMESRQWYISTAGRCIDVVNVDDLADMFLSDLSDGWYYNAFIAYAAGCEKAVYIEQESELILTDSALVTQGSGGEGKTVLICLGIGLLVGLIVVLIMKAQLKTVKPQSGAANYVSEGLHLTRNADMFLYHTTTRREKPQNNSTHTGSSGRTHGGGGGRF